MKRLCVGVPLVLFLLGLGPTTACTGSRSTTLAPASAAPSASASSPAASSSATITPEAPSPLDLRALEPVSEVHLAPAEDGTLGGWLAAGPLSVGGTNPLATPPRGVVEADLRPEKDRPLGDSKGAPTWKLAFAPDGIIDVHGAIRTRGERLTAYLSGVLHLESAGTYWLLLSVKDGVRVDVDGKEVYVRDEVRPMRSDDDVVPLQLSAGDHTLTLKLRQREGTWTARVRLLDAANLRPPLGAYLKLPGTDDADVKNLAGKLTKATLRTVPKDDGYRALISLSHPAGQLRGRQPRVQGAIAPAGTSREKGKPPAPASSPLLETDWGTLPLDARGASARVLSQAIPLEWEGQSSRELLLSVTVGDVTKGLTLTLRKDAREALREADKVLALEARVAAIPLATYESAENARSRVLRAMERGDTDHEAVSAEVTELQSLVKDLAASVDPYATRTGAMRRAFLSPIDNALSEVGVYVPPSFASRDKDKKYPLVVGLHGLNGRPVSFLQWMFGHDHPGRDSEWEDRHVGRVGGVEAIVLAPDGHGNSMYRHLGEADILLAIEWAKKNYPIDNARITMTGVSMGGTGAGGIPLHTPSLFAASAPLCGYHSYFIRGDVAGRPIRPWEKLLMEERSTTHWAKNGMRLPLFVVHGKKDKPEENSGVLIDRYRALGYPLTRDHPDVGHDVWTKFYEGNQGLRWLLHHKRNEHPTHVRFRTMRTRFDRSGFVIIRQLEEPDAWGEVDARIIKGKNEIVVNTTKVRELELERDPASLDMAEPVVVTIDKSRFSFAPKDAIVLNKERGQWTPGSVKASGLSKRGRLTGSIRDAFFEPLTFVYGASDPAHARANEEVARAWSQVRYGVRVAYPIMSDREFVARGHSLAEYGRSLFLVGRASSNSLVAELGDALPIRIEADEVRIGTQRMRGKELGAAFVYPNPRRPDTYVVVVAGVDISGTYRSLSLPDILPDFVVYDAEVRKARGQQVLSFGVARAAGLFGMDWALPSTIEDPMAERARKGR